MNQRVGRMTEQDIPRTLSLEELEAMLTALPPADNPLGLFCLECGCYCHLSDDRKRWLCPQGHN